MYGLFSGTGNSKKPAEVSLRALVTVTDPPFAEQKKSRENYGCTCISKGHPVKQKMEQKCVYSDIISL